jgi:hypothetical protein
MVGDERVVDCCRSAAEVAEELLAQHLLACELVASPRLVVPFELAGFAAHAGACLAGCAADEAGGVRH